MRNSFLVLVTAAVAMTAVPGAAQVQQQDATVSTGLIIVPNGAPNTQQGTLPFAAAAIRTYTYQPVCELRREQFQDETGWRVRDVRVCR